jgi:hypothetical protein
MILSGLFHQFRLTVPFRLISFCFGSFRFREMTVSQNTNFRELAHLFREITKFILLPFFENFAKRYFDGNPTVQADSPVNLNIVAVLEKLTM